MTARTVFLSRLIGLYCILCATAMLIHRATVVATVTALVNDAPLMFIVGVLTLVAGLAMVLAHNVWSGGAATVVVTVVGWLTLAKGLLFLFLTPAGEARFFLVDLRYQELFPVYVGISLALGLYLTYAGFKPAPKSVATAGSG